MLIIAQAMMSFSVFRLDLLEIRFLNRINRENNGSREV